MVFYLLFMAGSLLTTFVLAIVYYSYGRYELVMSLGIISLSCFLGGLGSFGSFIDEEKQEYRNHFRPIEEYRYDPYKNIQQDTLTDSLEFYIFKTSKLTKEKQNEENY